MGKIVAVVGKQEENAASTVVTMLLALKRHRSSVYGVATPTAIKIEGSIEGLRKQETSSSVAVGCLFSKILERDKLHPMKLKDSTMVFDGRVYRDRIEESDVEVAAEKLKLNPEVAAKAFVKETEGDFAFALVQAEKVIAARDSMGARPLYYGENHSFAALASERKALWSIGITQPHCFPPGHVSIVNKNGFNFAVARKISPSRPKQITMEAASTRLKALLEWSVKVRTSDLKEVSVAFSGGLDSSLIAYLTKKRVANLILIHVSLQDQPDVEFAKSAAEELDLPICSYTFVDDDLERAIPEVIQAIEEPSPLKLSIGIPMWWAAEKTAEMGFKVMLAGQGADELFGGYKRYVDNYLHHGKERVRELVLKDTAKMYETNLERDFKICDSFDVELRLPFVTYKIARFAMEIPIELEMEKTSNTLRKLVLRHVTRDMGLPKSIVNKPKKAIQYTTGVNKALERIAKQKGVSVNEYVQGIFKASRAL